MSYETVLHYDNDPEFFRSFLCGYLKYGTGLYESEADWDFEAASLRMLDHVSDVGRVSAGSRVLDVGCGWGSLPKRLLERHAGVSYTGITPAQAQIDFVRESVSPSLSLVQSDFLTHDFGNARFDSIFFNGSYCHMTDKIAAFRKAKSLLSKEGAIVIQDTFFVSQAQYDSHKANEKTKYVQETIFGYADIVPLSQTAREAEELGLRVDFVRDYCDHYLKTLGEWIKRLGSLDPERFPLAKSYVDYLKFGAAGLNSLTAELCVRVVPQADRLATLRKNLREVSNVR